MLRILLSIILLLCLSQLSAQTDTLNQLDENGLKTGYWIFYGKDKPEKGYPTDGIIEEGIYFLGRKNGMWTKYFKDGKTPRLRGEYVNGRPNGKYWKYYENGQLRESGEYSRRRSVGTITRYYQCGAMASIEHFNEEGKKDGICWQYYNPCFCVDSLVKLPEMKMEYDSGILVGSRHNYYPSGCLKEVRWYHDDGEYIDREMYLDSCKGSLDTALTNCIVRTYVPSKPKNSPVQFEKDGFNRIFNDRHLLYQKGDFKDGKLYNGTVYFYDSEDILLKIEVWKVGEWAADSVLADSIPYSKCDPRYTEDEEGNPIWNGTCVDGKPWTGKLYVYDANGILEKIEIWQNGRAVGDGKL